MVDKKKTMQGLQIHWGNFTQGTGCNECPYLSNVFCTVELMTDIMMLLNEQNETVHVRKSGRLCTCANCCYTFDLKADPVPCVCPNCGKVVKWYES